LPSNGSFCPRLHRKRDHWTVSHVSLPMSLVSRASGVRGGNVSPLPIDPSSVGSIVADYGGDGDIASVNFTLRELYIESPERKLNLERYREIGGISDPMARYGENFFRGFDTSEVQAFEDALLSRFTQHRTDGFLDPEPVPASTLSAPAQVIFRAL